MPTDFDPLRQPSTLLAAQHVVEKPATLSISEQLEQYRTVTFDQRTERQTEMDSFKGTGIAYSRHVEEYEDWWADLQDQEQLKNPSAERITAHPINATKVALFLDYLMSRPKVRILSVLYIILT
jgi:hypothetical protein